MRRAGDDGDFILEIHFGGLFVHGLH
jgi:hypothetical protein